MRTVVTEPDALGFFGRFGGRFVPETVMGALEELTTAFERLRNDAAFNARLEHLLRTYVGRPTALTLAENLSAQLNAKVYLKREDLAHTGAHKINNALAQALLAKAIGKERLLAETGAGQHGVATATAGALLRLPVTVFMGTTDMARQKVNVERMRMLGATVEGVSEGAGTLKEATSEAIRHWVRHVKTDHYVIGSVVGPHPYPLLVRTFQSVIGREAREQILAREGRLPDAVIACVGGGSNAMGIFSAFVPDERVRLFGAEAGGIGEKTGEHAATIARGGEGVLHGAHSRLLADAEGRISPTRSISAGLDYPGVGPEHAHLAATGRAQYRAVTDAEAMEGLLMLTRNEGILPALESAHAVALAKPVARELGAGSLLLVNISGRGDKDLATILARLDAAGGAR